MAYRKLLVKISSHLDADEVKKLVFMADVNKQKAETIHQGIRLFECLEYRGDLGPEDFGYLLELLEGLERNDLINLVLKENPGACAVGPPNVPQGFSSSAQFMYLKRECILVKTGQYSKWMKKLKVAMHSGTAREGRFVRFFQKVAFQLHIVPGSSIEKQFGLSVAPAFERESYVESLVQLSIVWQIWPITLAAFDQNGFSSELSLLVDESHGIFDEFHHTLPPSLSHQSGKEVLDLRNKQQHPIGQIARHAHSILHELSSEMLGSTALEESNEMLKSAFFTIESLHYTARYLIPIYKWQTTLLSLVASHSIDGSCFCGILPRILSDHAKDIRENWDVIVDILGDEVAEKFNKLLPTESQATSGHKDTTYSCFRKCVTTPWYVTLAILGCFSECSIDHMKVQDSVFRYMHSQKEVFMQMYLELSQKMASSMEKEVQCFQRSYGQVIRKLTSSHESSKILMALFDHEST